MVVSEAKRAPRPPVRGARCTNGSFIRRHAALAPAWHAFLKLACGSQIFCLAGPSSPQRRTPVAIAIASGPNANCRSASDRLAMSARAPAAAPRAASRNTLVEALPAPLVRWSAIRSTRGEGCAPSAARRDLSARAAGHGYEVVLATVPHVLSACLTEVGPARSPACSLTRRWRRALVRRHWLLQADHEVLPVPAGLPEGHRQGRGGGAPHPHHGGPRARAPRRHHPAHPPAVPGHQHTHTPPATARPRAGRPLRARLPAAALAPAAQGGGARVRGPLHGRRV
jgi:hypothetical protein